MPKRPADLISVREATKLVDRSVSSLRAWIRADDIQGYREKEGKKNSRLMVSRAELLLYMGGTDKPVNPGRTTPEQTETDHRIALLEAELVAERSTSKEYVPSSEPCRLFSVKSGRRIIEYTSFMA